jgi:putative hemolysin
MLNRPAPIISVVVITILSLMLCEIIPKNLAIKHSLEITLLSALPMYVFYIIFFPVGKLFVFCSKIIIRIVGISYTGFSPDIFQKKEDVEIFLKANLKERFTKDERGFFLDSLDIGKKELTDIMVPLVEIHALPVTAKIRHCRNFVCKYKKFYIPVYNQRIDNIEGIVYAHDLFGIDDNLPLSKIVREPIFVPEYNKIHELYKKLNNKDIPVVFTVDEHGGVTGMVTIYDIGEEIIGKVGIAEYYEDHVVKIKEGEYMCNGEVEIDEINKLLSTNIDQFNITNLNGLILKNLGKIPEKGDFIEDEGHRFLVVKSSKRKAELIQITKINNQ